MDHLRNERVGPGSSGLICRTPGCCVRIHHKHRRATRSFYVSRLVTLPLIVIVLLSFSVFWMDRSSLGDRISVSFIGILTAVAYQVVMSEILPQIAYVTWMNAFLNFSFLMMVGTVITNLAWVPSTSKESLNSRIASISGADGCFHSLILGLFCLHSVSRSWSCSLLQARTLAMLPCSWLLPPRCQSSPRSVPGNHYRR